MPVPRPIGTAIAGRGWPLSAAEEVSLAEQFRRGDNGDRSWTPNDLALVMGLLRGGGTIDQLTEAAPGVHLASLHGAYVSVASMLQHAHSSWARVVNAVHSAMTCDRADLAVAGLLMPEPVTQVRQLLTAGADSSDLIAVIDRVDDVTHKINAAERAVFNKPIETRAGAALNLLAVEAGDNVGLWEHPWFLPSRVGALSPGRVSGLVAGAQ